MAAPETASFSLTVDADPTPVFSWQASQDGSTWTVLPGAQGPIYVTPPTSMADQATLFRCLVTNAAGNVTTIPVTLHVTGPPMQPRIIAHPADCLAVSGEMVAFQVTVAGSPAPTLAWERSSDGGVSWRTLPGETSPCLSFAALREADNGALLRVVANNGIGSATSRAASLKLITLHAAGWQGSPDSGATWWVNRALGPALLPSQAMYEQPTDRWPGPCRATCLAISGSDVYIGGTISSGDGRHGATGHWLNGTWAGPNSLTDQSEVLALALNHGRVYEGGFQKTYYTPIPFPFLWLDGATLMNQPAWTSTVYGGMVNVVAFSGDDWYGAGYYGYLANQKVPGIWFNGAFSPLPVTGSGQVEALIVSGGDVYAAGGTAPLDTAMLWINGVASVVPGNHPSVHAMALDMGGLYLGGSCQDDAGRSLPGYWARNSWVALALPTGFVMGDVRALALVQGTVVAAGWVEDAQGARRPVWWLAGSPSLLAMDPRYGAGGIRAMAIEE